ncbi:putative polyvalent protein kinase domain-containing protein [Sphingobacterium phlebotomi]|uniref:putative polyvalent protein kinase domain-containing protein n=1 Tax=Sphingobacterium phlebotomi TaxID=2605433 RepID=UPI001CA34F5F
MEYNTFTNIRNNDYESKQHGIILEDLHDENVLFRAGVFYFFDTVFYLSKRFFDKN